MLYCVTFNLVSFAANMALINVPLVITPSMVIFSFFAQCPQIHQLATIKRPSPSLDQMFSWCTSPQPICTTYVYYCQQSNLRTYTNFQKHFATS